MIYLKQYESFIEEINSEDCDFEVGDNILCIKELDSEDHIGEYPLINQQFICLRIYTINTEEYKGQQFVNVKNVETNKNHLGWNSNIFRKMTDAELTAIKYNL